MAYRTKICGITNIEDARVAVTAGADALGFLLYRKSPRYVDPMIVQQIVAQLPPFILPVGVFVNEEIKIVRDLMDTCGLALAQLHGDESATYCRELRRPVLKALRLARQAAQAATVILAGGLTPENVGQALRAVQPYGVDVSSGVEVTPGKKDHEKIRAFLRAVSAVSS